ncbi:KRAB [Mytilus edulis]|uniref:KRAB n=1 Tax=Mytilus edulis TaxID=6550 RepID=A0A8S3RUS3_MYTED|nr:KRAB [Mytilus edulis]
MLTEVIKQHTDTVLTEVIKQHTDTVLTEVIKQHTIVTEGDTAKKEPFTRKQEPVNIVTELVSIVTGQSTIETKSGAMVTGPVIQSQKLDTYRKSTFSEKMFNALNQDSLENSTTTTNANSSSNPAKICFTNTLNQPTNENTLQTLTNKSYQPRNQNTLQGSAENFTKTSAKEVLNEPFTQSQQSSKTAEMSPNALIDPDEMSSDALIDPDEMSPDALIDPDEMSSDALIDPDEMSPDALIDPDEMSSDALIDPDEIKKEIVDYLEQSGTSELILSRDTVRNGQEIDGDNDNSREAQNGQELEEGKEIKLEPTDAESNLYTYEKISHLNKYVGKKSRKVYKLYKCTVCKKTFDYLLCVQNHVRIHTGDRPYKCGACPKDFVTKCSLAEHEKVHTGDRPHVCHICGITFMQKYKLAIHLQKHNGESNFSCDICGKGFIRKDHLNNHIQSHNKDRPFSCKICGQSYKTEKSVKAHERSHAPGTFQCHFCHKVYTQNRYLKVHINEKHNLSPLDKSNGLTTRQKQKSELVECDICQKYYRKNYIKTHAKSHDESAKDFECQVCGKRFVTESYLNYHENIHTESDFCPEEINTIRSHRKKRQIKEDDENAKPKPKRKKISI